MVNIDDGARLRGIVGAPFVEAGTEADAIEGVRPAWVVEPDGAVELAAVLAAADAGGLSVIPRGGGTKIDWGGLPRAGAVIVSTSRLNRVLEHAAGDMTATVEAGCTVASLQETLARQGQRLALDPLWPGRATVGGVLAANDSGILRGAFGGLRDLIIGVTVALADGTVARSGGKVVKNVAGYDLPKLFTGSFGSLGVITQATFRLHPLPHATRTIRFAHPHGTSAGALLAALNDCSLVTAGVQLELANDRPSAVAVRVEGLTEAIEAKGSRVIHAARDVGASDEDDGGEPLAAREGLFSDVGDGSAVCKVGVLRTRWPAVIDAIKQINASTGVRWRLVAQAMGVGLLRLDATDSDQLPEVIRAAREAVSRLGGTLAVLRCPSGVKPLIDIWGPPGDALPLMQRIKQQFDPRDTLCPGRFVGGI